MKAIILKRYGSTENLEIQDLEKPVPKPDEVLIRVCATSVNDWDWSLLQGSPFYIRLLAGFFRPKVRIPGAEVAGVVEAAGNAVTRFQPGDAVYGDLSEAGFGAYAEYVAAPEAALVPKPEGMKFLEAAALPHASALAMQALGDPGRLKPGDRILINGAGGGVGTLGIQIANTRGVAEVDGVDHTSKKKILGRVGFQTVYDYTSEDFTRVESTYDLILDTKTNRPPWRYLQSLKPGGRYVTVGGSPFRLIQVLLFGRLLRWWTGKTLAIVALKPNQDMERINQLYTEGRIRPLLDGPYRFFEIPKAIDHFGSGQHQGKVVISMDAP